jgi:thioesterase domain-containing protein
MGLRVEGYDGEQLVVASPLKPNVNVHGTGFAGSLYGLAALAGWGLVHLKLEDDAIAGQIVLAKAQVSYSKPVRDDFQATCRVTDEVYAQFKEILLRRGRAKIELDVEVGCRGDVAARYEGQYLVTLP